MAFINATEKDAITGIPQDRMNAMLYHCIAGKNEQERFYFFQGIEGDFHLKNIGKKNAVYWDELFCALIAHDDVYFAAIESVFIDDPSLMCHIFTEAHHYAGHTLLSAAILNEKPAIALALLALYKKNPGNMIFALNHRGEMRGGPHKHGTPLAFVREALAKPGLAAENKTAFEQLKDQLEALEKKFRPARGLTALPRAIIAGIFVGVGLVAVYAINVLFKNEKTKAALFRMQDYWESTVTNVLTPPLAVKLIRGPAAEESPAPRPTTASPAGEGLTFAPHYTPGQSAAPSPVPEEQQRLQTTVAERPSGATLG